MVADHLGRAPGLEVNRIPAPGAPQNVRVSLDFTSGLRGPFLTLTVDQWTALQHAARTITWPAA
jgi:hypothetical protein